MEFQNLHPLEEVLVQVIATMVTDQARRQRVATLGERIRAEDGEGNVALPQAIISRFETESQ
jgi:hypothetical protein